MMLTIKDFVIESNRVEGINRNPFQAELEGVDNVIKQIADA